MGTNRDVVKHNGLVTPPSPGSQSIKRAGYGGCGLDKFVPVEALHEMAQSTIWGLEEEVEASMGMR